MRRCSSRSRRGVPARGACSCGAREPAEQDGSCRAGHRRHRWRPTGAHDVYPVVINASGIEARHLPRTAACATASVAARSTVWWPPVSMSRSRAHTCRRAELDPFVLGTVRPVHKARSHALRCRCTCLRTPRSSMATVDGVPTSAFTFVERGRPSAVVSIDLPRDAPTSVTFTVRRAGNAMRSPRCRCNRWYATRTWSSRTCPVTPTDRPPRSNDHPTGAEDRSRRLLLVASHCCRGVVGLHRRPGGSCGQRPADVPSTTCETQSTRPMWLRSPQRRPRRRTRRDGRTTPWTVQCGVPSRPSPTWATPLRSPGRLPSPRDGRRRADPVARGLRRARPGQPVLRRPHRRRAAQLSRRAAGTRRLRRLARGRPDQQRPAERRRRMGPAGLDAQRAQAQAQLADAARGADHRRRCRRRAPRPARCRRTTHLVRRPAVPRGGPRARAG